MQEIRVRSILTILFKSSCVIAICTALPSLTLTYADDWNNAAGGTFGENSNWLDGSAPTATDTAEFDLGAGPYTVTLAQDHTVDQLIVHNDAVDFDLSGFTLEATNQFAFFAGFDIGDTATVTMTNGTFVTGFNANTPRGSDMNGSLTVSGPNFLWDAVGIRVAGSGSGSASLTIENGAQVDGNSVRLIGPFGFPAGPTSLTVTGAGSELDISSLQQSQGQVTVEDGGLIQTSLQTLVNGGSVTVTGENSRLRGTGSSVLRIADQGTEGTALLEVLQAGLADSPDLELAQAPGITGQIVIGGNVNGVDATVDISDDAFVGRQTPLAFEGDDTGTAIITVNEGGHLIVGDDFFLGSTAAVGSGTLNVAGGTVTARDLFIRPTGILDLEAGRVNVEGAMTTSGDLAIQGAAPTDNPIFASTAGNGVKTISGNLYIGGDNGGPGNPATVKSFGNGLRPTGDAIVYANGTLEVGSQSEGELGAFDATHLSAAGEVNVFTNVLNGLSVQSLAITGTFNWTQGRIDVLGPQGLSTNDLPDSNLVVPEFGMLEVTTSTTVEAGDTITIGSNGEVNTDTLNVGVDGPADDPTSTVHVGGLISELNVTSDAYLGGNSSGAGNPGTLVASTNSQVSIGGTIKIWDSGILTLDGGTVVADSIENIDGGQIDFLGGSLTVSSGISVGNGTFTRSITVTSDQVLITPATTNIAPFRTLTLDGGTLNTGDLAIQGTLQFNSGTLGITGAGGLTVGAAGPFGSLLSIGAGQNLEVTNTLSVDPGATLSLTTGGDISANTLGNSGIVQGSGNVSATLANQTGGLVRVQVGDLLTFTDTAHTNEGDIQLQDGRIDFLGSLTNNAGGNMLGRGTLSTTGGLTNLGDLALSNGQTDIFGDVDNQSTGRVIVSGNADVTFWDDVTDSGTLFNVSTGSSATFFGTAGFGIAGGGDVFFEADVTPGTSPGLETFGGNVHFGVSADLEIEIAGTAQGSQYDALDIAGLATLDGSLSVVLLDDFVPSPGHSFDILDWGTLDGEFSTINLPTLAGFTWDTSQLYTTGVLSVVAPGLAGDHNGDGTVDAADYVLWRRDPSSYGGAQGYTDWVGNFGQTLGSGSSLTTTAVPEPASALLMVLAAIFGIFIGRRAA